MDASLTAAKTVLKQEIERLTGTLAHLNASLAYLESLSPAAMATLLPAVALPSTTASAPSTAVPVAAVVKTPEPVAVVAPATIAAAPSNTAPKATATPLQSADVVAQLHKDVDAWAPKLSRVSLDELYLVATLDRPKHLAQLPSKFDGTNHEVLRILNNYLRHTEVVGYREFCARLKNFTGLAYLYKRVRDKATAAINSTYPELANGTFEFPVDGEKMAPSGATQFAALALLRPTLPAAKAST